VTTEDRLVGGWLLLTVTEDLIGAGVGRLRQRLLNSPAGHRHLVLDLTAVDRIDSTGLGVLVCALKRLRACDGQLRLLRLAAARGDVARVLHATGLDKVLPLYPDVASALEP
jgi:anti-sigma B factor antagonist